ncbi:MAG: type II secretion system protein [Candidatus Eremiobacteraeota bacterium]|nr:type II secretion system protein [Candidatus Eremiobacteraeota bacterium]
MPSSSHSPSSLSSKSQGAFTLVEVLITVGMALIVVTITFGSLLYSARASRDSRIKTNKDFELMKVYAQMRQQMLNLYASPNFPYSLIGEKGKDEGEDSIRFYTASPVVARGVCEASYSIQETEEGKLFLAYREFPYARKMDLIEDSTRLESEEELWRKMTDAVTGLSLTYMSEEKEYTEWREKSLPERIIVSLWYSAGSQVENFSFSVSPGMNALKKKTLKKQDRP